MPIKRIDYLATLLLLVSGAILTRAEPGTTKEERSTLPFIIEAAQDVSSRFPGIPRLQSFVWAQWKGKWIFLGGRSTGYHGVGGKEAEFARGGADDRIWVIDPSGPGPARTFSYPLSALPGSLALVRDQWMSTNSPFVQDGGTLYVAGGYGENSHGDWVTYPVLSSVDLDALVSGVMEGRDTFSKTIAFTENPLVQSAGGDLLKLDNRTFYLVGGHVFMGSYRGFESADEKNTAQVSQQYLGEIRKLNIGRDHQGHLNVTLAQAYRNPEFARRDLNTALTILPDGHGLGAAAYGGVFTKEQLAFVRPIYWSATMEPEPDAYEQKMSAYNCAKLLLFDPGSRTMYTTFFGGISGWVWNKGSQSFEQAPRQGDKTTSVYFDGMTWIDQITTLVRSAGETHEFVQPSHQLAGYVGTNAVFIPIPDIRKIRDDADIYDLSGLKGKRTLVGYIYGGVRAWPRQFPYLESSTAYSAGNVPTKSNDMIIAVYLTVPAS